MPDTSDLITVNVNVEITAIALQTIVENAKKLTGKNEKGHYSVDTADVLSEMISRFLYENNFEAYVKNSDHYRL